MNPHLADELAALGRLTVAGLRSRYAELFGEPTRTGNKTWLVRRLAWRLQALAEGDLSERARRRAAELAQDTDLRLSPPRHAPDVTTPAADGLPARLPPRGNHRLPPPGTLLTRLYKGQTLQVQVLERGFAYRGTIYPSLSAVAKAVTGSHCSGHLFFRLIPSRSRDAP